MAIFQFVPAGSYPPHVRYPPAPGTRRRHSIAREPAAPAYHALGRSAVRRGRVSGTPNLLRHGQAIRRQGFERDRRRQPIFLQIVVTFQHQKLIRHPPVTVPPVAVDPLKHRFRLPSRRHHQSGQRLFQRRIHGLVIVFQRTTVAAEDHVNPPAWRRVNWSRDPPAKKRRSPQKTRGPTGSHTTGQSHAIGQFRRPDDPPARRPADSAA